MFVCIMFVCSFSRAAACTKGKHIYIGLEYTDVLRHSITYVTVDKQEYRTVLLNRGGDPGGLEWSGPYLKSRLAVSGGGQ